MQVRFGTTGCRLNQIESESAAHFFYDKSFSVSLEPLTAKSQNDLECLVCVINTCSVTQKAEQKDRRIIRLYLEKCPNATIIVTGCYAQLSPKIILAIDSRIAVLPGQNKSRLAQIPSILAENLDSFNPVNFAKSLNESIFNIDSKNLGKSEDAFKLSTDSFLAHSRSSIKIQDGCNNNCTYCTINKARGHSVSLAPKEVIHRVKKLEEVGQNEVVFTTVNIGQYCGEYNGRNINFAQLLELCLEHTRNISFRISSLYPEVVDDYFCSVIKNPRVCPHFHISVQSGSDDVLRRMARRYSSQDVVSACAKLRLAKENPFIACDIITGFPGETEQDFCKTMELCEKCNFSWVHVFPFSERPGTLAAKMDNKVPQFISGERAKQLSHWAENSKKEFIESCCGKIYDAILETVNHSLLFNAGEGKTAFHAVTENFLHCKIIALESKCSNLRQGQRIKVKIIAPIQQGIQKGGESDCIAEFYKI